MHMVAGVSMIVVFVRDCGSERVVSVSTNHINDASSADSLSRRLASMFESELLAGQGVDSPANQAGQLIDTLTLDFQRVGWLSSQGLNELISINRLVRTRGVRLILANVQEPVRKVFALTRLERMFEVLEPKAQAG